MEVRIQNFRGYGAREAKAKVFRHFKYYPREYWHFYTELDERTGTAIYGGRYLAYAWTGRHDDRPQFPVWLWQRVARIRFSPARKWLLLKMMRISGKKISGMNS